MERAVGESSSVGVAAETVQLAPHRSWPELVMHVLAHVKATAALPASVYDPIYVGWARERLGPAEGRTLGEDALVLGNALPSHTELARAQLLGWLFDDVEQASAVADRELSQLGPGDVERPELLAPLVGMGPSVEVLRAAAELEAEPWIERLGPPAGDDASFRMALARVMRAAPMVAHCRILRLRALRSRGRVHGSEIWVGAPVAELAVDDAQAAWQAAHEATVAEVSARSVLEERRAEAVALVLLAERAQRAGLIDEHRVWLGHLAGCGCPAGPGPPRIDRAALAKEELCVLDATASSTLTAL